MKKQVVVQNYIWIRMDADSQQILDQLTLAAEKSFAMRGGKAEAVISRCEGVESRSTAPVAHVLANGIVGR